MEEDIQDMEAMGQSKERIAEVSYRLRHLTPDFLKNYVVRYQTKEEAGKSTTNEEANEEKSGVEEEKKEEK